MRYTLVFFIIFVFVVGSNYITKSIQMSCSFGDMDEINYSVVNGGIEPKPWLPKSSFKLSENKDIYAFSQKEMTNNVKLFFQSKEIVFHWCPRCRSFNCSLPRDDLVFRVRCMPHATPQSSILEFVRLSGCPIVFTELYREFRSTLSDQTTTPISLSHCMQELNDVPALSSIETDAAVAALKYWILCDPVEASEAIEAYESTIPACTFHMLRSEAIHACKVLDMASEHGQSSPDKGVPCCCYEDDCQNDTVSFLDRSESISDDIIAEH